MKKLLVEVLLSLFFVTPSFAAEDSKAPEEVSLEKQKELLVERLAGGKLETWVDATMDALSSKENPSAEDASAEEISMRKDVTDAVVSALRKNADEASDLFINKMPETSVRRAYQILQEPGVLEKLNFIHYQRVKAAIIARLDKEKVEGFSAEPYELTQEQDSAVDQFVPEAIEGRPFIKGFIYQAFVAKYSAEELSSFSKMMKEWYALCTSKIIL